MYAQSFLDHAESWAERARAAGEPLATAERYETAGRLYMKSCDILDEYGVDLTKRDVAGQIRARGLSASEAARVWRALWYVLELAATMSDHGAVEAEIRSVKGGA